MILFFESLGSYLVQDLCRTYASRLVFLLHNYMVKLLCCVLVQNYHAHRASQKVFPLKNCRNLIRNSVRIYVFISFANNTNISRGDEIPIFVD